MAALDYRFWRMLILQVSFVALALLVLVLQFGAVWGGAQRWFDLEGDVLPALGDGEAGDDHRAGRIRLLPWLAHARPLLIRVGLLAAVPAILVFIEPDLGTSLIFIAIWLGIAVVVTHAPAST